jgi:L-methionine (R)-S-oxide reductase
LTEELVVNKSLSDNEKYELLFLQLKSLIDKTDNVISTLSNIGAAIKQTFDKVSWVGFYLFDGENLFLGPFQGKIACTKIKPGKGVCGTSAFKRETIIVPDVNEFPGHIACDPDSKSEIVVPIIKPDGELFGVLDLDSSSYNSFNEIDKLHLEKIITFLTEEIL